MHRPTSQEALPFRYFIPLLSQTDILSMQDVRIRMQFSGECVHESTAQGSLTSTCYLDENLLAIKKG